MSSLYTLNMYVDDDRALTESRRAKGDEWDDVCTLSYFADKYEDLVGRDATDHILKLFHIVSSFITDNEEALLEDGLARTTVDEHILEIHQALVEAILESFEYEPGALLPPSSLFGPDQNLDYPAVAERARSCMAALNGWDSHSLAP